jgi:hypothetical protein
VVWCLFQWEVASSQAAGKNQVGEVAIFVIGIQTKKIVFIMERTWAVTGTGGLAYLNNRNGLVMRR